MVENIARMRRDKDSQLSRPWVKSLAVGHLSGWKSSGKIRFVHLRMVHLLSYFDRRDCVDRIDSAPTLLANLIDGACPGSGVGW
jgi:hypothetical protein